MPNQPQDPLAQSTTDYGPFTSALTGPLTPQNQAQPLSGAPSKSGAIALYLGKFLQGAQAAQRTNFERSEQNKREQEAAVYAARNRAMADPTFSAEGKAAYSAAFEKGLAQKTDAQLKEAEKAAKAAGVKDPHPLLALTRQITNSVLGPGENKKHKDLGSFALELQQIRSKPEYQIDANSIGADAAKQLSETTSRIKAGTPAQQGEAAPQGPSTQEMAGQQGYLANKYPAQSTPPTPQKDFRAPFPGKAAVLGEDPNIKNVLNDPAMVAINSRMVRETGQGLADNPYTRDVIATLPKTGSIKPIGTAQTIIDPNDPEKKRQIRVQGYFDPATNETTYKTVGEPPPVKATTVEENRQNLIRDMKASHPDWTDDQVNKAIAQLDVDAATNKAAPKTVKPTAEATLAQDIADSGGANSPEDAKKKAATILTDQAKKRAAPPVRTPPGAVLAPSSPDGKALISKAADNPGFDADAVSYGLTGKTPGIAGGGKESAAQRKELRDRWYQIAKIMNLNPDDIEALRGGVTADKSALSKMTWLNASVTQFEDTLQRNMKLAEQLNAKYDRSGIKFSNRIQNWYKGEKNDQDVNNFMSQVRVMAPEYAKIMSGSTSNTGATVSGASDANKIFDTALSQGGFQSLLDNVVKPDLANRKGALDASKNQLLDKLRGKNAVANASGGGATASRFSQADQAAHADDIKQIDPSKDSLKVKGHGVNDKLPNGMTVQGFTKDSNFVAW